MRKMCLLFAALLLTLALQGCMLAREDTAPAGQPRLIGALLTLQIPEFSDTLDAGRDDQGRPCFPGTGGYLVCMTTYPDEHGDIVNAAVCDEGVEMTDTMINVRDDGEDHSFSVSLYTAADALDGGVLCAFANPVYQAGERIYVQRGQGLYHSAGETEGAAFTTTLRETTTETVNGRAVTNTFSMTVRFAVRFPPSATILTEMSDTNTPLRTARFAPGELEAYTPGSDCAWILVEHLRNGTDGVIRERELIQQDDAYVYPWVRKDALICRQYADILWQDE